jgi:MFS family permease
MQTDPTASEADLQPDQPSANGWRFVPSLYFLQGIPNVVVTGMAVTMYKKMGIDNAQIGLWTSLIAWPWIAKMLWGPLVDNTGTKRAWILSMQAMIALGLGIAALFVESPNFLVLTLAAFFLIAFMSATHDIAADGFYLLALDEKRQAAFVGFRSLFFRFAMIFGTGFLVAYAGKLELEGVPIPKTWTIALAIAAGVYAVFTLFNAWALPKPVADPPREPAQIGKLALSFGQVLLLLLAVFLIGRWVVIGAAALNPTFGKPVFTKSVELTPLFAQAYPDQLIQARTSMAAEEGLKAGKAPDDPDMVAAAQARPRPFVSDTLVIPYAVQALVSLGLIAFAYFSTRNLFRRIGMGPAAREYFTQERLGWVLAFILFYRFGESMIGKMAVPFLLDPREKGGLGVATIAQGTITGTVGVAALALGGILGGWVIYKFGMKKSLWPMVLSLNIPNLFYLWLALRKPASPLSDKLANDGMQWFHIEAATPLLDFIVNIPSQIGNLGLILFEAINDPVGQVIFVDQFGYGFGFAAYMVYLMFISQGSKFRTSNYAISTGLMALGAMMAGILSGYLQQFLAAGNPTNGYFSFFVAVCILTIPGMITLLFIPMKGEDVRETVEVA